MGRFLKESSYCRQPDSGNPTVRDERRACGNVGYGGTRNPLHNRKGADGHLHLRVRAPYIYSTVPVKQIQKMFNWIHPVKYLEE